MERSSLQAALEDHLRWWGLRQFASQAAYFQWQREVLSREDLLELNRLAEHKRAFPHEAHSEVAFYDFAARPSVLPVLFSQRYDYYCAVGPLICAKIGEARTVLDAGCGIGLLTTWYARLFPTLTVLGVDRSEASLEVARDHARQLGLFNVRFEPVDLQATAPPGRFDLILATQALYQSEQDPGLPSEGWATFTRHREPRVQQEFERRTGLGYRLDHLCEALQPSGRMILLEKTRHLGRRVPFQRALEARGFHLLEAPIPLQYRAVDEIEEDGPLFVLGRTSDGSRPGGARGAVRWEEGPEVREDQDLYACRGEAGRWVWERLPDRTMIRVEEWRDGCLGAVRAEWGQAAKSLAYLSLSLTNGFFGILVGKLGPREGLDCGCGRALSQAGRQGGELEPLMEKIWPHDGTREELSQVPLYENHTCAAQAVWDSLKGRRVLKESTSEEPGGRQRHIELGALPGLMYVYWANTYDQRQLVIVEAQRARLLEEYYAESLEGDRGGDCP